MTGPSTVLVVEDEGIVATHIQVSLEELGYAVPEVATSGEEAVRLAQKLRPSLILMDICLDGGEVDGIDAAMAIRQELAVPVVFLTANSDEPTLARAREAAPYGFLLKPFNTRELRTTIEVALYRHRMEQAVHERERWLTTTLRSIGDAVIATDPGGRVMFVNPVAEALLGRDGASCVGRPVAEIFAIRAEAGGPPRPPPTERALAERRACTLPPGTLLCRPGGDLPIEETAAPIIDASGRLLGAVLVFRDISARRRLERRLAASARLAAIGTIAAGIAHEVNNPLSWVTANVSYVSGVLADHPDGALPDGDVKEVHAALGEAALGANRVARILRGLRIFARGVDDRAEEATLFALDPLVSGVVHGLTTDRARFTIQLGGAPEVEANEDRLGEVITHLIANALQASATEIRVRTGTDPEGRAFLEVADDGVGMAPEVRERVFDPFYTTKGPGGGTGLGLAVCHGIIVALGGTIEVESAPGAGSRFRVALPAART